jgi:phage terminase large subunit-like protein
MVLFTPMGIAGETTGDRVDALVWALAQLMPGIVRKVDYAAMFADEGNGMQGSGAWMGA